MVRDNGQTLTLKVFHAHKLVGEYPQTYHWVIDVNDSDALVIYDADPRHGGKEVKRFPAGEWHAGGHNIRCGFAGDDPDPDCPNCHVPLPAPPESATPGVS